MSLEILYLKCFVGIDSVARRWVVHNVCLFFRQPPSVRETGVDVLVIRPHLVNYLCREKLIEDLIGNLSFYHVASDRMRYTSKL